MEHEGAAIAGWFVTLSQGQASAFDPRIMNKVSDLLDYQVYKESPPLTWIVLDTAAGLSTDDVVTSGDFGAATLEQQSFSVVVYIPMNRFVPAGSYADSVLLSLYTGTPANPGSHMLKDTASVALSGRMAQIIDITSVREPGIRSLDLSASLTNFLIAAVYETSNADPGYTVSVTSENLVNDGVGHTGPYFQLESGPDTLSYELSYDGAAAEPWAAGTAMVTDSGSITASSGNARDVRITYPGNAGPAYGDYRDTLTIAISAK